MMDNIDAKDLTTSTFSRRDFLKLTGQATISVGAALAAHELGKLSGATERSSGNFYLENNFVDKPELLTNPAFVDKMKDDLSGLTQMTDGFIQRESVREGLSQMSIDTKKWKSSSEKLVKETVRWADNVVFSKENKLDSVYYEVDNKYRELSSYLRSLLIIYDSHKGDSSMEIDDYFLHLKIDEHLFDIVSGRNETGQKPEMGIDRTDISTIWSYDWEKLIKNEKVSNPITHLLWEVGGDSLENFPYKGSKLYLPDRDVSIKKDVLTFGQRPQKTEIINFDPEVKVEISGLLKKLGLERANQNISWMGTAEFPWGRNNMNGSGAEIAGPKDLTIEEYKKYQNIYDSIIVHEFWHSLSDRSILLGDKERLEFRNLQLGILKRFNPLASMKNIFAPVGEYPDTGSFSEQMDFYNELYKNKSGGYMAVTDYFFYVLETPNGQYIESSRDELRNGFNVLTGVDIFKDLYLQKSDYSLDSLFSRIENTQAVMDDFSKYVAGILIENKDAIIEAKRIRFAGNGWQTYYVDQVLPYTIIHTALYRQEEFIKHLPKSDNPELLKNFVQNWQKRLDRFISQMPIEDLTGDIFVAALLNSNKFDGNIDWIETKRDFDQMLKILVNNGLAITQDNQIVG